MTDTVERPANGYSLSLYDQLQRDVRDFNREIVWRRQQAAMHSRELSSARSMLVRSERTLAWMEEFQAEEIAELEAARARVRAVLKGATRRENGVK